MSRVEPTNRSDQKRENQPRQPQQTSNAGHTPTKAEGDERTVDEALRNQEKRK